MNRRELRDRLEAGMAPAEREEWDNDGLLVAADMEKRVCRVLLALDVTDDVVSAAIRGGYDAILSHHPLLFSPLSSVTPEGQIASRVVSLLGADVAVFCYHTRLDRAAGGVNDTLAGLLGLSAVTPVGDGILRVGTVPETTAGAFAALVRERLGCPAVLAAGGDRRVSRVAVCGGEGKDYVEAAKAAGADLYLSGRLGYHTMTDAAGITLLEAGHYYTEAPVLGTLREWLLSFDPSLTCDVLDSNAIRAY